MEGKIQGVTFVEAGFSSKMKEQCFAVIGMGLIGGSYAKALKKLGVKNVVGVDVDKTVLQKAMAAGVADSVHEQPGSFLAQADVIICCVYPKAVTDFLKQARPFIKKGALVTDVAGRKGNLPYEAQRLMPEGAEFISGHPMAGRQGSGFEMSQAEIFDGANYIVVPTPANSSAAAAWLKNFALALGCGHVEEISPEEHDRIIAYTSNLPHAAAAALINSDRYSGKSCWFIGGGFRDVTRIADINAALWSDLFLENRSNVLRELIHFKKQIELLQKLIDENDRAGLQDFLRRAACHRKDIVL